MYRHMVRFMPYNIQGMGNVLVFEILTAIKIGHFKPKHMLQV